MHGKGGIVIIAILALLLIAGATYFGTGVMGSGIATDLFDLSGSKSNLDPHKANISEKDANVYLADPLTAYQKLQCETEYLFGKYAVRETENTELPPAVKTAFLENMNYFNITGTTMRVSAVPYRIDFGPHCNVTPLNYLSGYQWAQLYFYDSHGDPVQVQAACNVDGTLLNMRLIRNFEFNSRAGTLDYNFSGNTLQYGFTLDARGLVLSNSDGNVTLAPMDLQGENAQINIYDAYATEGSPLLDGIDMINITPEEQYVIVDGEQCRVTNYEADPNGLFKMRWLVGNEKHSVQVAYLYCDDDGIILLDGSNVYNYTHRSKNLYTKHITTNLRMADSERLENLSEEEIASIRNKVNDLYEDLQKAFDEAGVEAKIDKETGEIALNSVVLFEFDKYQISSEGQAMLSNFLKAYTSVIFSEKYQGMISEIEIEGHTDPEGLIYHNEVLSKARAEQVMTYCQTTGNGLDTETIAKLTPMLSAVGYASAHPVFGEDGKVDYAASRRVSFKFVVDIGAMEQ